MRKKVLIDNENRFEVNEKYFDNFKFFTEEFIAERYKNFLLLLSKLSEFYLYKERYL